MYPWVKDGIYIFNKSETTLWNWVIFKCLLNSSSWFFYIFFLFCEFGESCMFLYSELNKSIIVQMQKYYKNYKYKQIWVPVFHSGIIYLNCQAWTTKITQWYISGNQKKNYNFVWDWQLFLWIILKISYHNLWQIFLFTNFDHTLSKYVMYVYTINQEVSICQTVFLQLVHTSAIL